MKRFLLHPRRPFLTLFLICAGLLGFGLYLQLVEGVEPCPMCILQRYAFVGVGLTALIGGLHGPRGGGRKVYWGLILLLALAGGGVAARQTWIQIDPPLITECGPDLSYMLGRLPLAQALPKIFQGAGDCSLIDWTFLNLSIANWSLLVFICTVLGSLMMLRLRAR